ncbi:MAG: hypothetical protein Q9196_002926 [Gyalolechia fulgens]
MSAESAPTTAGARSRYIFLPNDIIPPDYTVQIKMPHPNVILMSRNTYKVQRLLLKIDRERHHLERGLNRLRFQNYWLKRGQDTTIDDSVLAPFDEARWTVEGLENMYLEVMKNEIIRKYSKNLFLVREQHEVRQWNDVLREGLRARRQTDEGPETEGTGYPHMRL